MGREPSNRSGFSKPHPALLACVFVFWDYFLTLHNLIYYTDGCHRNEKHEMERVPKTCSITQGSYGEETMLCHWLLLSQEWLMTSCYLTTSLEWAPQLEECRYKSEMIKNEEWEGNKETKSGLMSFLAFRCMTHRSIVLSLGLKYFFLIHWKHPDRAAGAQVMHRTCHHLLNREGAQSRCWDCQVLQEHPGQELSSVFGSGLRTMCFNQHLSLFPWTTFKLLSSEKSFCLVPIPLSNRTQTLLITTLV